MGKVCSRKDCSRVGETQPIDNFYFRTKTGKHYPQCKECSKRDVAKAQKGSDRYREYQRDYHRERRKVDPEFAERAREIGRKHDAKPKRKQKVKDYWASKANDVEWLEKRRENRRQYLRDYRNTPEGKERDRNKTSADYASGKRKAQHAVYWAVQLGILKKTGVCVAPNAYGRICWGKTSWHHYNGYAEENWLDVVELCQRHHRMADNEAGVGSISEEDLKEGEG